MAIDERFKGMEGCFGAVYYNFPHSGAIQGFFDGHPVVNWRHENLMRLFFRALRSFMKPGGIVKACLEDIEGDRIDPSPPWHVCVSLGDSVSADVCI